MEASTAEVIEISLREFSKKMRKNMTVTEDLFDIAISDDPLKTRLLAAQKILDRMENSR